MTVFEKNMDFQQNLFHAGADYDLTFLRPEKVGNAEVMMKSIVRGNTWTADYRLAVDFFVDSPNIQLLRIGFIYEKKSDTASLEYIRAFRDDDDVSMYTKDPASVKIILPSWLMRKAELAVKEKLRQYGHSTLNFS